MSQENEDEIKEELEPEEIKEEEAEPEIKEPDEEARATRMGWSPKEQFRGDPSKWVDAKTFIERGETMLPILRERLNKQEEINRELKETVQDFRGYISKTEQRAYERAKRELEDDRKAAKEAGDIDKFEQATNELHKLETDKPKNGEAKSPIEDPVFKGWIDENEWFKTDPKMAAYANGIGQFIRETEPALVGRDYLDEVTKQVKERFKEKFENPRRNGVARVEAGSGSVPKKTNAKTYNELPPDAKRECDRYVKQGLLKKEEYVKTYFEE